MTKKIILSVLLLLININALHALDNKKIIDADKNPITINKDSEDENFESDDFEDEDFNITDNKDYLETYNKMMTNFNVEIYDYVLMPIADSYDYVVPDAIQDGLYNMLENIKYPVSVFSNALQLKIKNVGTESLRFLINSTIGILGFFDVADSFFKIKKHKEDIGQVFGYYGMTEINYLVLPILGPSSIRDFTGDIINWVLNPFYYMDSRPYNILSNYYQTYTIIGTENIDFLNRNKKNYNSIINKKNKEDNYINMKVFYEEYRKKLIKE